VKELVAREPLGSNILELHPFERPTNDHHDIDSWHEEVTGRTEGLAYQSLGAVANDGGSDSARRDDAEPRFARFGSRVQQENEMREYRFSSRALSRLELEALLKALRGRKTTDGYRTRHYFL